MSLRGAVVAATEVVAMERLYPIGKLRASFLTWRSSLTESINECNCYDDWSPSEAPYVYLKKRKSFLDKRLSCNNFRSNIPTMLTVVIYMKSIPE